jgi:GMP synthase (glutamine-hydrolysing)
VADVVVCLKHEDPDDLGVGEEMLRAEGFEVEYVRLWERDALPMVADLQALVILGGEMNADQTERYPFLGSERELIRECAAASVPTLGICLGAQVMARAFDAPVAAGNSREAGFLPIHPTAAARLDPLLSVYDEGDRVLRWHEDAFELPRPGELLLAGEAPAPNQAFRVGRSCWGVQFHPEVTRELVEEWLGMVGGRLESHWGRTEAEFRRDIERYLPAQQERSRELFRRFAALVRERGARPAPT